MDSSRFQTGKRIGTELLEDMLRENNGLEPIIQREIHRQRYFTLMDDSDFSGFLGFLYGFARVYARHPIKTYKMIHRYD